MAGIAADGTQVGSHQTLFTSQQKPDETTVSSCKKVIYKCAVATTKPDETAPPPQGIILSFCRYLLHRPAHLLPPCLPPFLLCLYPGVSLSKLIVLLSWLVVAFAWLIHSTSHCITTNPLVPRICPEYVCFVLPFSLFYSMPRRTGAKKIKPSYVGNSVPSRAVA